MVVFSILLIFMSLCAGKLFVYIFVKLKLLGKKE